MEAISDAKNEANNTDKGKKKRSWGDKFITFLSYGGFILILVVGVIVAVVISMLFK